MTTTAVLATKIPTDCESARRAKWWPWPSTRRKANNILIEISDLEETGHRGAGQREQRVDEAEIDVAFV